jgi:hypothetical protein
VWSFMSVLIHINAVLSPGCYPVQPLEVMVAVVLVVLEDDLHYFIF